MTRIVVPTRNARFDLSAAEEYGELYILMDRDRPSPLNPTELAYRVEEEILEMDFDPDVDLVVLTGNTIEVSVTLAVVARMFPRVRLLLFDARTSGYMPAILDDVGVRYPSPVDPARGAPRGSGG